MNNRIKYYEDGTRRIESDGFSFFITARGATRQLAVDSKIAPPDKPVMKQLRGMGESPSDWFTLANERGISMAALPNICLPAVQEAQEAARMARAARGAKPENIERQAIWRLLDRAVSLEQRPQEDNVSGPAQLRAEARKRLAAWREMYPEAARKEDVATLRSRAGKQRELARGALSFDADGWLDSTERQKRYEELIKRAEELETEARELEGK